MEHMHSCIRSYVQGEFRTAWLLIVWGMVALGLGGWCWATQPDLQLQGLCFPVMMFAAVHLVSGLMQWLQTHKRAPKLLAKEFPTRSVLVEEMLRLDVMMPKYKFYRRSAIAVVVLGLAMTLAGSLAGLGKYMVGTGAGLALQAAITLIIDLFSAMRAGLFHHELRKYL